MWPKCGCRPLLCFPPTGRAFPHCSMGSTRGKFSSAGCSLIQFGGESQPRPGLETVCEEGEPVKIIRPIGVYAGRRCSVNGGD
ncbi:DNA-3-methyladenine glycosylase [Lates japonicus]|uniref:DNA-3-methyladenine glycosylase n=1 Tax=Lates japonicus TaxID=270547 RepID=A0AAD3QZD1_LATJO|nr:DNA-3-methyladenine glycosylase [Lates japonicus]